MRDNDVVELQATVDGGPERKVIGRFAWALLRLIEAGEKGCTPINQPAPRWSNYIFRLRRQGVAIETITEKHAGAYAGTHARYVLRSLVEVSKVVRAEEVRDGA